jgi:starch phosphorylase
MNRLQIYQVFPDIPKSLSFLEKLSRNLWWCWHLDAIELFRRIDPGLWSKAGRNPIVFLTLISQGHLDELAKDESFLAHQKRVEASFEKQVTTPTDFSVSKYEHDDTIAYFSMEFGIHESLPLFSGGLGVLSGDHLKAVSDMDMPLTGVGLLYRRGFFHQFLDQSGWQQEEYPKIDIYNLPVERAKDPLGNEVQISITGPEDEIKAVVWKLMVGHIPLYLLDTDLPDNPPEIREITSKLYAGGHKMRLAQEMLLGIGGMRALTAMGINPTVELLFLPPIHR